jgi:hypothetical protein
MTFQDKPTCENVIFGQFNLRRLESTHILERGLVFKCHRTTLLSGFAYNFNLRHYTMVSEQVLLREEAEEAKMYQRRAEAKVRRCRLNR